MPKLQDSLYRQWHMLRAIPRHPQKVTAQTLRQSLYDAGFDVSERTVQRDLTDLSGVFPLISDEREKPFGWSWKKDARNFDLPGLTVPESLTLVLAEQHLSGLLPSSVVGQLKRYFDLANQRLNHEPQPAHFRSWLDKVRTVPSTQPLLPPQIDPLVQEVISEALLHEKQVLVRYQRRGNRAPTEYQIHPLALVQRGTVIYVHARIRDYPDPRTLALHRIRSATLTDECVEYPENYQVDETIKAGVWGFGSGELAQVHLLFEAGCADHLYETPLSADQKITERDDGQVEILSTLAITPQLTWWLLGFGDGVEVIAPQSLREKFASVAAGMAKIYARS